MFQSISQTTSESKSTASYGESMGAPPGGGGYLGLPYDPLQEGEILINIGCFARISPVTIR